MKNIQYDILIFTDSNITKGMHLNIFITFHSTSLPRHFSVLILLGIRSHSSWHTGSFEVGLNSPVGRAGTLVVPISPSSQVLTRDTPSLFQLSSSPTLQDFPQNTCLFQRPGSPCQSCDPVTPSQRSVHPFRAFSKRAQGPENQSFHQLLQLPSDSQTTWNLPPL